jgi:hypothetical protein
VIFLLGMLLCCADQPMDEFDVVDDIISVLLCLAVNLMLWILGNISAIRCCGW